MSVRWRAITLAIALVLLSASSQGCGGSSTHLQPPAGQPPNIAVNNVIPVVMKPQEPATPPFAEAFGKVPANVPSALLQRFPQPTTLVPPTRRASSFSWAELDRNATDYGLLLPAVMVSPNAEDPTALNFQPNWSPGQGLDGTAYCIYEFALPGFDTGGDPQTIGLNWLLPAIQKEAWIGVADFGENDWKWFEGPEDGVLTLSSFSHFEGAAGRILIAIILAGNMPATLKSVHVGQQETRGIGDLGPAPAALYTMIPHINVALWPFLPDAVDLSPGCAPINDQNQVGACTAFANADSGFNYELENTYGAYGWNFSSAFNRCSPRYVYNQTGVDLGGGCPTGGRTTNDVGDWLLTHGTATEQNAPTGTTAVPGYNCSTSWSAAALSDAALLVPDSKTFIGTDLGGGNYHWTDADIATAKHVLKTLRHVIVFRTYVDSNFQYVNYAGGACWTYNGSSIGGHAMCVVGYDMSKNGGAGAFKVRNSWGTGFGDNGYCWLTFDTMKSTTAGVYGYYLTEECNNSVISRFLPGAPSLFWPCAFRIKQFFLDKILLEWEPVAGASRYEIFRDNQDQPIGEGNAGDTSFEDLGIMPPDTDAHVYWIRAINAQGQPSEFSPPAVGWLLPAI